MVLTGAASPAPDADPTDTSLATRTRIHRSLSYRSGASEPVARHVSGPPGSTDRGSRLPLSEVRIAAASCQQPPRRLQLARHGDPPNRLWPTPLSQACSCTCRHWKSGVWQLRIRSVQMKLAARHTDLHRRHSSSGDCPYHVREYSALDDPVRGTNPTPSARRC